jgi:hypothetical protein
MGSFLSTGPSSFVSIAGTDAAPVVLGAATAGRKQRLLALACHAGAAGCTFRLTSGTNAITGDITVAANGPVVLPEAIGGWAESAGAAALNLVVTAGAINGCAVVQSIL